MASQPLTLEIQTGKHKGRRVRLTEAEIIVGRGEESRIKIASGEVSREHCKLIPQTDSVLVIDLKSRNGTFVDGRPVNGQRILRPGGSLTVGPLTFILIGNTDSSASLETRVRLKGKSGSADDLSDDDIANWLSDSEMPTTGGMFPTETSIIKNSAPADSLPVKAAVEPPAAVPQAAPGSSWQAPVTRRPEFKSVADEAREIIRRHLESVSAAAGE